MDSLNSILLVINILLMLLVVIAMGALKKYIDSVIELHDAIKDCFDVDDSLIKSIIDSNNSVRAQCENTEKSYDLVMKQYKSMQNSYDLVTKQYESMYAAYIKIIDNGDQRYNEFNITCSAEESNDKPDSDQVNWKKVTEPIEIHTVPINTTLPLEEVSMLNIDYDAFKETQNALY